ncbi:MAG TPA: leucyl aminopeptidase [Rhodospirillaceae bacterium]|nr:leucyl aminopeptidase [Rhodospirillaceae bacterium]
MSDPIFNTPKCFLNKKRKHHILVTTLTEKGCDTWLKSQPASIKTLVSETGFKARSGQIIVVRNAKGRAEKVFTGVRGPLSIYDLASTADSLMKSLSGEALEEISFEIDTKGLKKEEIVSAHIGWALACYRFDAFRGNGRRLPALLWAPKTDKARVNAFVENICMLRNLVNMPSNNMGPEEVEKAARNLATPHKAVISVTKGATLDKEFPMVAAVGNSSPRAPRLIDLKWGNAKHPKLTLVGKGVCFDTGGLDIKPSASMRTMKKDMAGAAHTLALAGLIMSLKIPVRLRVIIPAVENAVSGTSFRPGDIFTSRKGLTIENTNTDAEGRLILSDALTLASEEKPDLIIDFATLTGSARTALGQEIPAMFSNNDKLARQLQDISMQAEDPLWQMPLWSPYNRHNDSSVADLQNSAGIPGDLIYSALFLQNFLVGKPDWVHLDIFAWESSGKPGRAQGGLDTGLRAAFAFIEDRYGR